MVCEGLFNLFGTSSAEVIARAKEESDAYYLPQINELSSFNRQLSFSNEKLTSTNRELSSSNRQLSSSNKQLSSSNQTLSSQIDYLKNLLRQNNIAFDLNEASGGTDIPNQ